MNDMWRIGGVSEDPTFKVQVFNRHGSVVFTGNDGFKGWDGKYKGNDVPIGVYYYRITTDRSLKPMSGTVTLIR